MITAIRRMEKVRCNLAYEAELESRCDIQEFAEILLQYLDRANREDKKLVCEIWVEE